MYFLVIIKPVMLLRHNTKYMHQYGYYRIHRLEEAELYQDLKIPRNSTEVCKKDALQQHLINWLKTQIKLRKQFDQLFLFL